jgi:hypothetical protein
MIRPRVLAEPAVVTYCRGRLAPHLVRLNRVPGSSGLNESGGPIQAADDEAAVDITLGRMRLVTAVVLDLCCVMAFVMIGRAGHSEGETIAGIATTAWPFLSGLLIGWAATRGWRRPAALVSTGVGVWLVTVAVGMALRVVSGQGTAVTFVLVALVFLGLVMFGWRAVAYAYRRMAA